MVSYKHKNVVVIILLLFIVLGGKKNPGLFTDEFCLAMTIPISSSACPP